MQSPSRWVMRAQLLAALGLMLALTACSAGGGNGANTGSQGNIVPTNTPAATPTTPPTATPPPTPTPTPFPTLTPAECGPNFTTPTYDTHLVDNDTTDVYGQVLLPPETFSYDNDASGGFRGKELCTAGTVASITAFMTQNLTQLGWQMQSNLNACDTAIPGYAQNQCWQNGGHSLYIAINSNTDWVITHRDPAFQ